MKVMVVDDERLLVRQLKEMCEGIPDISSVKGFDDPHEAIEYVKRHEIDLAYLDVEMPEMSGIQLARKLKEIDDDIKIVFVTGYSQYAYDAFKVDAIDYITKPYIIENIEKSIMKANKLISTKKQSRVVIRTFGRFDVFIDNKLVIFPSTKSKELLAILVDANGGNVTMEQAITILWEDRYYDEKVKRLYRNAIMDLRKVLEIYDVQDLIGVARASIYLDPSKVECDYYAFLNKDREAINNYAGEYMFEYSWAEKTTCKIDDWFERNMQKSFGIR